MALQLGQVIAERQLAVGGSRRHLMVRLGAPKSVKVDWMCPYQLLGLGRKTVRGAFGVDSFQALVMALESIREDLAAINEPLTWVGGEAGDPGFGLIVHSFLGPAGTARVEKVIDREANRYFSGAIAARNKGRTAAHQQGRKAFRGRSRR